MIPSAYFLFFSACMGLVVGSFMNVVVARLPHGKSVVRPRSQCPGCAQGIAWYDNIPVLSYAILRGRCRSCQKAISFRYPMIELLGGVLFLAATARHGFSWLLWVRDWPLLAILLAVTFIDLEHRIIPDELSLGGLALALATGYFDPRVGWLESVLGAALGFGLFYGLAWAYEKYAGRSGLGGGDIKLLALLGAFLGPSGVLTTILISSVTGSLVGIVLAVTQRRKDVMTLAIPYGPFLVLGGLYYYLLGDFLWLRFMNPT